MQKPRPAIFAGFIVACVLLRLLPFALYRFFGMSIDPSTTIYPWNFSPFYAMCLFGAAFMVRRRDAYVVMLGAWLIGDLGIGLLTGDVGNAFFRSQIGNYAGFGLLIGCGFVLRTYRSWWAIGGTGLVGATVFFLVSNFGVWALGYNIGGQVLYTYPHTWGGLMQCYAAGIPFYRTTLVSMAIFLPVLFSGYALKSEAPEPAAELAMQPN